MVDVVPQTDGATPLLVASQNGHVEATQALLTAGAAVDRAKVPRKPRESKAVSVHFVLPRVQFFVVRVV